MIRIYLMLIALLFLAGCKKEDPKTWMNVHVIWSRITAPGELTAYPSQGEIGNATVYIYKGNDITSGNATYSGSGLLSMSGTNVPVYKTLQTVSNGVAHIDNLDPGIYGVLVDIAALVEPASTITTWVKGTITLPYPLYGNSIELKIDLGTLKPTDIGL